MSRHPLARSALPFPAPRSWLRTQRLARPAPSRPLLHRLRDLRRADNPAGGELARDARVALLEAILFAADEPLSLRRLATLLGGEPTEARQLVTRLQELYERDGTAFQVEEVAGGFQLLTRAQYHPWLARLRRDAPETILSAPARETLAIVAYRQPVTRADLEAIRGVGCTELLRLLMDRGLVRIAGRDESLGRPQLYATTKKFLQVFGLRSLRDLPRADGLTPPRERRKSAGEGEGDEEK